MDRTTLKHPFPLLHPNPAVIIGVYEGGKPNFTTIGDIAVAGLRPPLIMISMHENHMSTEVINKKKRFSVNIPTKEMMPKVDYCGVYSAKNLDKSCVFEYHLEDDIPLVDQSPIHLICEVLHSHQIEQRVIMVCSILKTVVASNLLQDGLLDLTSVKSLLYGLDNRYYTIGEVIGKGYEEYKKGTE